ncbi:hypothetical protein L1887_38376 [Cichorium endivia]|nr:hypothetical protein L1887_38376 [Cichorium endivia]
MAPESGGAWSAQFRGLSRLSKSTTTLRQPTGDSQQLFGSSDCRQSILASTSYIFRSPFDKSTIRQQVNSHSSSTYTV